MVDTVGVTNTIEDAVVPEEQAAYEAAWGAAFDEQPEVESDDMTARAKEAASPINTQQAVLIRMKHTGESLGDALYNVASIYRNSDEAARREAGIFTRKVVDGIPQAVEQQISEAKDTTEVAAVLEDGAAAIADAEVPRTTEEVAIEALSGEVTPLPPAFQTKPMSEWSSGDIVAAMASANWSKQQKRDAALWGMYKITEEEIAKYNGDMKGWEAAKDATSTALDWVTGLDILDMKTYATLIGMKPEDDASIGPIGAWTLNFAEYLRQDILWVRSLPPEQMMEEFQKRAAWAAYDQTGIQARLLLDLYTNPEGVYNLDNNVFTNPFHPAMMTLDQTLLLGSMARLGVKAWGKAASSATVSHRMAQLNNAKKAYQTFLDLAPVKGSDKTRMLGPKATEANIAGSVDPIAGATTDGKIPTTLPLEADKGLQEILDATQQRLVEEDLGVVRDVAASDSVMQDIAYGLRHTTLFENALLPEEMVAAVKQGIISSMKKTTTAGIDDVRIVTEADGSWGGKVEIAVTGDSKMLTGVIQTDDVGNLHYVPTSADDGVRFILDAELTLDKITGGYEVTKATWKDNSLVQFMLSPRARSVTDVDKSTSAAAIRLDGTSQEIANQLNAAYKIALKPISNAVTGVRKKSLEKVQAVLQKGDEWLVNGKEEGREFTKQELVTMGLDSTERTAYYNIRNLQKHLFGITNVETRKALTLKGFKNIKLVDVTSDGDKTINLMGKPLSGPQELAKIPEVSVWNADTKMEIRSSDILSNWKTEWEPSGYRLVRMHSGSSRGLNPENINKAYRYTLVKESSIGALPDNVLKWRAGYMPRSYDRALYFVREFDTEGNFVKTHRYFDNLDEAEMFASDMRSGNYGGKVGNAYSAQSEGEFLRMNADESLFEGAPDIVGGLYTSARGAKRLEFGHPKLDHVRQVGRTDIMESLKSQMSSLAMHLPRNTWRLGQEQRLRNNIRTALGEAVANEWQGLRDPIPTGGNRTVSKALENRRIQLAKFAGVHDAAETGYQNATRAIYEWAVRPNTARSKVPYFSDLAWFVKEADPIAKMRSISFHALLGMGRIDQIWVQAQGASFAVSLNIHNPAKLAKIFAQQALISRAVFSTEKDIAMLAKVTKQNPEEIIALGRLYKRSGLHAGMDTSADWIGAEKGYSLGYDGLRRVLDAGLIPYRAGEGFNRTFSFLTSLDEFTSGKRLLSNGKSLKGIKYAEIGEEALKEITTRANDLMFNLGKANQAGWQEHRLTALPTQFLQVQAKLLEDVLGFTGTLSKGDRIRLFVGQLALYGTVGVPFGDFLLTSAMNTYAGSPEERDRILRENPKLAKFVRDGFWGTLVYMAFNVDAALGRRGSIASGVEEAITRMMADDEVGAMDVVLGAFGATWEEVPRSLRAIYTTSVSVADNKGVPTKADTLAALVAFARMAASFRGAERAWAMNRLNELRSNSGALLDAKDFSVAEEIFVASGITLSDQERIYDLETVTRGLQKERAAVAKEVYLMMHDFAMSRSIDSYGDFSEEEAQSLFNSVKSYLNLYYKDSPDEQQAVMDIVDAKLRDPDTKLGKAIDRYLKEMGNLSADRAIEIGSARNTTTETVIPELNGGQ